MMSRPLGVGIFFAAQMQNIKAISIDASASSLTLYIVDENKLKNKEIGIEKNLEFFVDQVNENYSARLKYTI